MEIKSRSSIALLLAVTLVACAVTPAPNTAAESVTQPTIPPKIAQDENSRQFASLIEAANLGNLDAQFILAQSYEVGKGIDKNIDKAFLWYGKAANAGHVPAQFFFGAMYASSRGTPGDVPKAIHWYRKAADKGYPDALYPVAYAYELGLGGLPKDDREALVWYRKAADIGNPFAFQRLAKAYRFGELGLEVDEKQASIFEEKQKNSGQSLVSVPVVNQ